jgi:hypothetical protein
MGRKPPREILMLVEPDKIHKETGLADAEDYAGNRASLDWV